MTIAYHRRKKVFIATQNFSPQFWVENIWGKLSKNIVVISRKRRLKGSIGEGSRRERSLGRVYGGRYHGWRKEFREQYFID